MKARKPMIAASVALACSLSSAQAENFVAEATSAWQVYMAAADGDKRAAKQVLQVTDLLYQTYPDHPFVTLIRGANLALKGRDAKMPWSKWQYTQQALELLEQAVEQLEPEHRLISVQGVPLDLHVQSQAGIIFTLVPRFFNRLEQGEQYLQAVLDDPALEQCPQETVNLIQYYAEQAAAKSAG